MSDQRMVCRHCGAKLVLTEWKGVTGIAHALPICEPFQAYRAAQLATRNTIEVVKS